MVHNSPELSWAQSQNVLGSSPASSDLLKSERQMKQCWIKYWKNLKKFPFKKIYKNSPVDSLHNTAIHYFFFLGKIKRRPFVYSYCSSLFCFSNLLLKKFLRWVYCLYGAGDNDFAAGKSISRAIGRGWPWKSILLWALIWQRAKPVPFRPKKSRVHSFVIFWSKKQSISRAFNSWRNQCCGFCHLRCQFEKIARFSPNARNIFRRAVNPLAQFCT